MDSRSGLRRSPSASTGRSPGSSCSRSASARGRSRIGCSATSYSASTAGSMRSGTDASTQDGFLLAAVLASGEDALVTHRSAGAVWQIRRWAGPIELTVPWMRRTPGLKLYESAIPPTSAPTSAASPSRPSPARCSTSPRCSARPTSSLPSNRPRRCGSRTGLRCRICSSATRAGRERACCDRSWTRPTSARRSRAASSRTPFSASSPTPACRHRPG